MTLDYQRLVISGQVANNAKCALLNRLNSYQLEAIVIQINKQRNEDTTVLLDQDTPLCMRHKTMHKSTPCQCYYSVIKSILKQFKLQM